MDEWLCGDRKVAIRISMLLAIVLPSSAVANDEVRIEPAVIDAAETQISDAAPEQVPDDELARRPKTLGGGNYLALLGDFDPRPYERTHLGERLFLGAGHFQEKNRRWIEDGLAIGGYYSANVQAGSESGGTHSISEFLLTGHWEPLRTTNQRGRLLFGFAHDQTIGSLLTRRFADDQRLVETPNDLDTSPDKTFTTLGLLAWDHAIWSDEDSGWGYRAGQLFAAGFFGLTGYLDDDRNYFMARPLAAAGGAQWVGANDIGLGAQIVRWRGPWYATGAIMDGSADRQFPDFDSLGDGRFLYVAEAGFERDLGGASEMSVRLTVTHLDATVEDGVTKPAGQSAILSFDRRMSEDWVVAARWSKSYQRLSSDYRELYSAGVIRLQPFSMDGDSIGLGLFVGRPSDNSRGDEYGAEIFYKLRLMQDISIMPDLQYWHRDDPDGESARTLVFGLRINFSY
jgi:hypothetical protein